jgi:drug/metabolite transporter (DMT)-like permease
VGIGAVGTVLVLLVTRDRLPRDRRSWITMLVLGLTNVAIPFTLITWSEKSIDSAVASILNASVPLFTLLISHFSLKDDRMTLRTVLGMLAGFAGVVVLLSKDIQPGQHNSVLGQLAVVLASLFYAGSTVFARKGTEQVPGLVRGAVPLLSASLAMWLIIPTIEKPVVLPAMPLTWLAVGWLGVLGSAVGLIIFYYLLHEIGPTRSSLVTYIFPLGGVILGLVFLKETVTWQLFMGAVLIVISLVIVNLRSRRQKQVLAAVEPTLGE